MKKLLLLLVTLMAIGGNIKAQNAAELMFGGNYAAHEIWIDKQIPLKFDKDTSLSFFNYTRYRVNYQNKDLNELLGFATVNYNLRYGFSLCYGGYMDFVDGFNPLIGLNYYKEGGTKHKYTFNAFVSRELDAQPANNLFIFAQYRPLVQGSTRLFFQLIIDATYTDTNLDYSDNLFRVGADFNGYQLGFAWDFYNYRDYDYGGGWDLEGNVGLYFRTDL